MPPRVLPDPGERHRPVTREDKRIALVWRRFALTDACREADLVLAHVDALYPCSDGTAIIDPAGISTSGGILGYSDEAGFRLESVNKDG